MFSAEDYLQGWIAYCVGASCLLLFLWLVLRNSAWITVRHILLLLAASILLTPVTAYRDDSHLAPAFFVSLYEGVMVSGADAGFQRGLAPIIAVAIFAILLYLLLRVLWRVISRKSAAGNSPAKKNANKKLRGAKLNPKQDFAD
ncbi:MAG: hypothetical protein ACPGF6_07250 [Porticoccaceae bacterium]